MSNTCSGSRSKAAAAAAGGRHGGGANGDAGAYIETNPEAAVSKFDEFMNGVLMVKKTRVGHVLGIPICCSIAAFCYFFRALLWHERLRIGGF